MRKLQGFPNEFLYVLPRSVLDNFTFSPVIKNLYFTDIGFYPNAKHHYVHRTNGAKEWILIFCADGAGAVISQKHAWRITRGTLILLPPNQEHTYYASQEDPWDIYWVHFSGDFVKSYLPGGLDQPDDFHAFDNLTDENVKYLMSLFWEMLQALRQGFSYQSVFYVSQMLGALLAYIGMHFSSDTAHTSVANEYVNHALQYIYDHIDQKITLQELANHLDVSVSYLGRLFRNSVGTSVNAFITSTKMQQASHFIQNTTLSVQQIAQKFGYTDQFYFSRQFKKEFGRSPLKFRQQ